MTSHYLDNLTRHLIYAKNGCKYHSHHLQQREKSATRFISGLETQCRAFLDVDRSLLRWSASSSRTRFRSRLVPSFVVSTLRDVAGERERPRLPVLLLLALLLLLLLCFFELLNRSSPELACIKTVIDGITGGYIFIHITIATLA